MRITSFAPSMTQPTYAVSSAPQGTFGASTPVVRSVAPTATETQRSGAFPSLPKYGRNAFSALALPLLLLVGCGEGTARSAESLVQKATATANVTEVAPTIFQKRLASTPILDFSIPSSRCPLPVEKRGGVFTMTGFDHFVTGTNTPSGVLEGLTQAQKIDCASAMAVLKGPAQSSSSLDTQFNSAGLTDLLESSDPAVQLAGVNLQGTAVSTGMASDALSRGSCQRAIAWLELTDKLVAEKTEQGLLSDGHVEMATAAYDYKPVEQDALKIFGLDKVCKAIDEGLPEARRENVREAIEAAGRLFNIFGEERGKLN